MQKEYTATRRSCKVTFELPAKSKAKRVVVLGDFNDWNPEKHVLKRRKDGSFALTVSLQPGNAYRFRYLVDGERWENDHSADTYVPNPFGGDDSVVEV